jgi:hypothetical protein
MVPGTKVAFPCLMWGVVFHCPSGLFSVPTNITSERSGV